MTAGQTSVPGAIDGLVAKCQAVAAAWPTTIGVLDGPQRHSFETYFAVGFGTGRDGEAAVAVDSALVGLTLGKDRETYAIVCQVSTGAGSGGGTTFKSLRDECFALLDALADQLAADKKLGGAVMSARIEVTDYVPRSTTKGMTVTLPFHVHIDAFRRPAQ
jgi:hypothetical protein